MKKERATMSDEARERMLITEQIERAAAEKDGKSESPDADGDKPAVEEGLKRDEGEKLVLNISLKPVASAATDSDTPMLSTATSGGLKFNALKAHAANPLKRPNVFKMSSSKAFGDKEKEPEKVNGKKRDALMSAAERLIFEEQERKRRRMERDGERLAS